MSGILKGSSIYKGNAIYNDGTGGGGGGMPMPEGYEQIESVTLPDDVNMKGFEFSVSDPNSAIEIDLVLNKILPSSSKMMFTINGTYARIQQMQWGYDNVLSYNDQVIDRYTDPIIVDQLITDKVKIKSILDFSNNKLIWNGREHSIGFPTLTLFCVGSRPWNAKCTSMTIFDIIARDSNNNITYFGVPAKRTLDEVEGIIDIVSNTFYTP